jgi:hypothetical protein
MDASFSKKAAFRCFEVQVPPDRRLLSWCIEHPDQLTPPSVSQPPTQAEQRRRSLICDEPPGTRSAVQAQARKRVANDPIGRPAWWRFERATEVDCVLATDRLVLCIEGKRGERLSRKTEWLSGRHQVARNLEAASRLAGVHRFFAVLVCVENKGDPFADPAFVRSSIGIASPHLFHSERAALADAYLGELCWDEVCDALGLNVSDLPSTVADLPRWLIEATAIVGPEPFRPTS